MNKLHPYPCYRMVKSQTEGPQSNLAGILQNSVFPFSHKWHPPTGKLDPDLVGPAGMQLNPDTAHGIRL